MSDERITPRAGFIGVDAIDPVRGGGTDGFVEVGLNTPIERRFGGTEATNAAGARHMIFDFGVNNANGDMYYRNGNQLLRLSAGNPGQVLQISAARMPMWGIGAGPGDGGPGGGMEEAPINGRYHVRTDGEWSEDIDDGVY